ncbi:unnamed protein product [Chironomus riparius]|uniref:Uncharacterized protein n=1 Tax=Chironomus riparius TaxID=315576 RepID=A0A9N9S412_9DIPT|nr:unnamed protein product [Chironomus riparius]
MNQTFAHLPAPSPYLIIKIKLLGQLKIDLLNLLISTKLPSTPTNHQTNYILTNVFIRKSMRELLINGIRTYEITSSYKKKNN